MSQRIIFNLQCLINAIFSPPIQFFKTMDCLPSMCSLTKLVCTTITRHIYFQLRVSNPINNNCSLTGCKICTRIYKPNFLAGCHTQGLTFNDIFLKIISREFQKEFPRISFSRVSKNIFFTSFSENVFSTNFEFSQELSKIH